MSVNQDTIECLILCSKNTLKKVVEKTEIGKNETAEMSKKEYSEYIIEGFPNIIKYVIGKNKKEIKKILMNLDKNDSIFEIDSIYNQIEDIFDKYVEKFKKVPNNRNTQYEIAAGFTDLSRSGSKNFCSALGHFFEEVWDLSNRYDTILLNNKKNTGGNDGQNKTTFFESKSRYDTMKGSNAKKEIKSKLETSIKNGKNFFLLIMTDINNTKRNIPLHKGVGLNVIKNVTGYDETKHRWISEDNVYEELFPHYPIKVKNKILECLSTLKFS